MPLTTVASPTAEMVKYAVEYLINRLNGQASGPQRLVLEPQLVRRDSVGAMRSRR